MEGVGLGCMEWEGATVGALGRAAEGEGGQGAQPVGRGKGCEAGARQV